ncbi:alpha-L-fucosidase [Parasediminibacterium sp. JCM 36343]|uniref:alpha-L-fucosidase n=1 Tax=Parasediminibacterium sp. JCM 36343 TaxID=3374279 RepID=UPI0039793F3F
MKKTTTCLLLLILLTKTMFAQEPKAPAYNDPKMDWWKEARFGMFIHWGIYAVPAGTYNGNKVNGIGEWIMNKGKIPVADYKKFASEFNPVKYNAEQWVKLAKEAGMKYMIITSKHHDGFAMFKSEDPFNIVDATPFKRDAIKELAAACKKYNMKLGLYYSQAQDWTYPGGSAIGGHWDSAQNGGMGKYIDQKVIPQLKEILSNYGPISVLWFDTPTGMTKEYATKVMDVLKQYPDLIYNNRLGGGYSGDLETPEQYIPATGYPGKNWESCMTMNNTWGFKSYDTSWKSTAVLINNLIDIASKGGNYLLNVGPTSEGLIPQPSVERLKAVGAWLATNGEAIYGTTASPFSYVSFGRCTRKKDKLYLHVLKWPVDGIIKVPLDNKIVKASLLAQPKTKVTYKKAGKYLELQLPKKPVDSIASVVVLQIEGEPAITVTDPIPSFKKPATASSIKSDANKASLAFDGNGKKGWIAADGEKTGWLATDLGKPTSIGSIAITEAGTFDKFVQRFRLEYKDGQDWKTVFEDKNIGAGYFKTFKPVIAQQFRINILETTKVPQIKQVQLYFDEE